MRGGPALPCRLPEHPLAPGGIRLASGGPPCYGRSMRAFVGEECLVDQRSDLYSLGVILYELLAGQLPHPDYRGPNATLTAQKLLALRRTPPPRVGSLNPAVSPAVDAIVAKLLEPSPARRSTWI